MKSVVCDIDGVIINQVATMKSITKDYSFNPTTWEFPQPYLFLIYVTEIMPPNKIFYYPKMINLINKYFESGYDVFFITSRPKILNLFTLRTLRYVFPNKEIHIINSKEKYDGCAKYYKNADIFFEDSPLLFPKLYEINERGVLISHPYNKDLQKIYPSMPPM